ncbi:MAG: hypothetical protein MJ211_13590 [Bacteroidales bacterium]|nr:hypothetical protein [Bacteroidales bacterium]
MLKKSFLLATIIVATLVSLHKSINIYKTNLSLRIDDIELLAFGEGGPGDTTVIVINLNYVQYNSSNTSNNSNDVTGKGNVGNNFIGVSGSASTGNTNTSQYDSTWYNYSGSVQAIGVDSAIIQQTFNSAQQQFFNTITH